jgi:uncharacterized protein YcaQ
MKRYTWEMAWRRRLSRQHLLAPAPPAQLVDVVRAVGGIQAQILSAAELALGARVVEVSREDVRAAIWQQRALVKTYGPRGTLHLLPADELPLWMAALGEAATLSGTPWYVHAHLEPAQAEALLDAIAVALDGQTLTRKQLAEAVVGQVGEWARERLLSAWGELLSPAAFAGKLCFGPAQGSQVTFARADQWIGFWQQHDPHAALVELCRRYIATYGPSTRADVAHWFRLKPDQAQQLLTAPGDTLEEVDFDGRRAWVLAEDVAHETQGSQESVSGTLLLLPQYDTYLLGSGPRERIVPEAARPRVNSYRRGRFEGATALPVLLIDGAVAGIWDRRTSGRGAAKVNELQVEVFGQLTAGQRKQLEAEVARIDAFLGEPLSLALGTLDE